MIDNRRAPTPATEHCSRLIDLHVHTRFSDSPLAPTEVVARAHRSGVRWLAITDHDTTAGLPDCVDVAARLGIGFIPGVEVTARAPKGGIVHILGYGLQPDGAAWLDTVLAPVRESRTAACRSAVESLHDRGYDIAWPQVECHAKGSGVFKVHIMRALVDAGYDTRLKGALYSDLCRPGGLLDAKIPAVEAAVAIRQIHSVGGVAVLAHPGLFDALASCGDLVRLGLDGLEVYHPAHLPKIVALALSLAKQYGLLVTGGSDYHGPYEDYGATLGRTTLTIGHLLAMFERIRANGGLVYTGFYRPARPTSRAVAGRGRARRDPVIP